MVLKIGTGESPYYSTAENIKRTMAYAADVNQKKIADEQAQVDSFMRALESNPDPEYATFVRQQIEGMGGYENELKLMDSWSAQRQQQRDAEESFYGNFDQGAVPAVETAYDPGQDEVVNPWPESGPMHFGVPVAGMESGGTDQEFRPGDAGPAPAAPPSGPMGHMSTGELMRAYNQVPAGPARTAIAEEVKRRTAVEEPQEFTGDYANIQLAGEQGYLDPSQVDTAIEAKAGAGLSASAAEANRDRDRSAVLAQEKFDYQQAQDAKREEAGGAGTGKEPGPTYLQAQNEVTAVMTRENAALSAIVGTEYAPPPFSMEVTKRITQMRLGRLEGNADDAVKLNIYGNPSFVDHAVKIIAKKTITIPHIARQKIDQDARQVMKENKWMSPREAHGYAVYDTLRKLELGGQ